MLHFEQSKFDPGCLSVIIVAMVLLALIGISEGLKPKEADNAYRNRTPVEMDCEMYRYTKVRDLPAGCLRHFGVEANRVAP